MAEIQSLVSAVMRRIEGSEEKIFKEMKSLEASVRSIATSVSAQYVSPPENLDVTVGDDVNQGFKPPSPAPTALSGGSDGPRHMPKDEGLLPNIRHPFKEYPSTPPPSTNTKTQTSVHAGGADWIHALPPNHHPLNIEYSPCGKTGGPDKKDTTRNLSLIKDGDDQIMAFISQECERLGVLLGGLGEPLVPGRYKDEPDVVQAYIFRAKRWGVRTSMKLYRLPSGSLLFPDEPTASSIPSSILEQRRGTWSITHNAWYRFISTVGPSRFPGLSEGCWEDILEAPPEQTRSMFLQTLNRYMGYAGTETLTEPLPSIIPELIREFDATFPSTLTYIERPIGSLLAELDAFEARRNLEARDATYLWRAVLWSVFPKHCMKHLRNNAVGGSDPRWSIVHAEFAQRLERRKEMWDAISQYRFPNGSYVPHCDPIQGQNQHFKILMYESLSLSRLLVSWRGGPVALSVLVIPYLVTLSEKPEPLTDQDLRHWMRLHEEVQRFYESKFTLSF
ncbi:hypothetical protein FRC17_005829 [Serendipita sp. 399]|nr:hypothetical protein FRC17_005829 [Serendipita sp. 399]